MAAHRESCKGGGWRAAEKQLQRIGRRLAGENKTLGGRRRRRQACVRISVSGFLAAGGCIGAPWRSWRRAINGVISGVVMQSAAAGVSAALSLLKWLIDIWRHGGGAGIVASVAAAGGGGGNVGWPRIISWRSAPRLTVGESWKRPMYQRRRHADGISGDIRSIGLTSGLWRGARGPLRRTRIPDCRRYPAWPYGGGPLAAAGGVTWYRIMKAASTTLAYGVGG